MITVAVQGESVDINENASFNIGAKSPFTNPGELWGPKVYNVSALDSAVNNRVFKFAKLLNNTNRIKSYADTQIKFGDLLWKIGTLKMRDYEGAYNFSFHTDAGDIEARIKSRTLAGMDLGSAPADQNVSAIYPAANHVFFTVKNPDFYPTDKNPAYQGYINEYAGSLKRPEVDGDGFPIVPFPYLLYILDTIFKELGYFGITGEWTEDVNIRRVTVDNNYELRGNTIIYNRHVPPISIGGFLIDVAINFGITYKVNPVTRFIEIIQIKDWLKNPAYTDFNNRTGRGYKIVPNDVDGFRFWMRKDDTDKLFETEPSWMSERIGNGSVVVETQASPLQMITEGARTLPHKLQEGSGPVFDLSLDSRGGLRFMLLTGTATGHYMRPGFSLRWQGADGILARSYTEWMDWKSYTEYMERTVELTLVELLQLDTQRKVMIDNLKWVVDEYDASITASGKANRIKTGLKLYSIKL